MGCDKVWQPVLPDVGVKSSQMFPKVAQTIAVAVLQKNEVFQNCPRSCKSFGQLLLENLSLQKLQNSPNLVTLSKVSIFYSIFD